MNWVLSSLPFTQGWVTWCNSHLKWVVLSLIVKTQPKPWILILDRGWGANGIFEIKISDFGYLKKKSRNFSGNKPNSIRITSYAQPVYPPNFDAFVVKPTFKIRNFVDVKHNINYHLFDFLTPFFTCISISITVENNMI